MLNYLARRIVIMIPLLFVISVTSFIIIQLPPGDYVETYVNNLQRSGNPLDESIIKMLRERYALDKPLPLQYAIWMKNILVQGDFGNSFAYNRPVRDILLERVPRTIAITLAGIILAWIIAVPIGIYSAVHQYSIMDYVFTLIGFLGLSIPAFMYAIVLVFLIYHKTGWAITGLFSPEFKHAAWSFAKLFDLIKNVSIPLLVLSTSGAAGLIRILRATMLDELKKQYVTTARAKGVRELKLLFKYPVRLAINPLISTLGWILPAAVGGEVVVSQVLNLPTTGPVLINAIMVEDMYLAGAIILILSSLTVIGTLLSDILLAAVDPRIRYG
ncbi:MAG: ABC transporter permease [bacterium]